MSNICISNSDMEPISSYYQWDIDQVIIISGLKVSGSITVHFCNVNSKNSIVVTPTVAGDVISVKVPNILLQNPEAIIIYVHRTDASTGSRTIYMSRIAVVPKAKPDDYIYTETEVLQYSALDERICALEKSTGIGGGIHIGPYPPDDPNVDIWLDTSEEETPPYIPNTINAKPGQIVRVVTVDENGAIVAVEAVDMPTGGESYELPAATADALGGIKAEPATEADTQPVRIGEDNKLYTIPGGNGGGEVWETINEAEVEDVVMAELACKFDDYRKVIIMLDGFGTKTAGRVNAHYGYPDSTNIKQICQTIGTTTTKRYGYVSIDTGTGLIINTQGTDWNASGTPLITTSDSVSQKNYIGATKVIILCIDSAGGGKVPSTNNTMMGKIKLLGVRK